MSFSNEIRIGTKLVSSSEPVFLIAEISANHNNDLNRTRKIIKEAAINGADAVKFQTYTADTITLNSNRPEFLIEGGLWDGRTLYDIYQEGSLPWEWHSELFDYARSLGLAVISSPFDESAVDFLLSEGVDALKIASFEVNHIPLIRKAASTGLPLIISTGMATDEEVLEVLNVLKEHQCTDLVLLHCISSYPALPEDYNLKSIQFLSDTFNSLVGLSDHCTDNLAAAASVSLGATVIEKHFTLSRDNGGLDDSFSLEPGGLSELRKNCDIISAAMKWNGFGCGVTESKSRSFRRSIYASADIKKGERFTEQNIRVVRPALGLHPRNYSDILNREATRDIHFAEPITEKDFSHEVLP